MNRSTGALLLALSATSWLACGGPRSETPPTEGGVSGGDSSAGDAASPSAPAGSLVHSFHYVPGPNWSADAPLSEQGLGPHFAYVGELFEEGTLLTNGLFGDRIEGLYVVDVPSEEDVRAIVDADPAVSAGILTLDAIEPWMLLMENLDVSHGEQQYFVLTYSPGSGWRPGLPLAEQDIGAHVGYMQGLLEDGSLLAAGPLVGTDLGRYVLAAADESALQALIDADPGVSSGLFRATPRPWTPVQRQAPRED